MFVVIVIWDIFLVLVGIPPIRATLDYVHSTKPITRLGMRSLCSASGSARSVDRAAPVIIITCEYNQDSYI